MTSVSFTPHQAGSWSRVVDEPVQYFEGDRDSLKSVAFEPIGTLTVFGNGFASQQTCLDRAREEVGALGGTHFRVLESGANVSQWTSPGSSTTTTTGQAYGHGSGNYAHASGSSVSQTVYTPGQTYDIVHPWASFWVVRVAPENWQRLPDSLRPRTRR